MTRAADRSTLRRAVVLLAATVTVGCSTRQAHSSVTPARYLFIWAGPPDHELLSLAGQGKLSDQVVLGREVRRMLADPRAEALATRFAAQSATRGGSGSPNLSSAIHSTSLRWR